MQVTEPVAYDPSKTRSNKTQKPHTLLDAGGLSVLVLVIALFAVPMRLFAASGHAAALAGSGVELQMLIWSSLIAVILPLLQIFIHIRRFGGATIRGNRDHYPVLEGLPGRIARAHTNLVESLLPFAIAVIAAQLLHSSDEKTVAAAALFLAARLIHAIAYVLGITIIRSAAYYAGVVATLTIAFQLPLLHLAG